MTAEEQLIEYEKVYCSFAYFLKTYGVISEPPMMGSNRKSGVIRFELWPHIVDVVKHLLKDRLIVVVKSRQIGLSWVLAHYALWIAITKDNARVMLFSKGEKECWELLGKCRFIWTQLPDFMKFTLKPDSSEELGFPSKMSKIKAFASTESAGVGETATVVISDETEWHQYASQNFLQLKPTIDAGGQYIMCSTVDKRRPSTLLKNTFKESYYDNKEGFVPLFYSYKVRPGRDGNWYDKTMESIPTDELAGLTPDLFMQQNYPRTINEALTPIQALSVFDLSILADMALDTRKPLDVKDKYPHINKNVCNIYKDYQIGKKYVASSDVAHGVGKDYSVTVVMDIKTKEVVADVMTNRMSVEDFTYNSVELLKCYKSPKWWPEDNDCGKWVIGTAKNLNYKNIGRYTERVRNSDGTTKIVKKGEGFHSHSSTRGLIWGELIPAINNRQVIIYNSKGLAQFNDVQYNIGKDGNKEPRIEAAIGRNDDYPTAVGIALWACDKVSDTPKVLKPLETLTFV